MRLPKQEWHGLAARQAARTNRRRAVPLLREQARQRVERIARELGDLAEVVDGGDVLGCPRRSVREAEQE
jgi:hypothetical protein